MPFRLDIESDAMAYEHLSNAEKSHRDEYCNLRAISDWEGFTPAQHNRKGEALKWLDAQRKEIFRRAEGEVDGVTAGWEQENRRKRYAMLTRDSLFGGTARREVRLPAAGCTPTEKSYIEEREVYLAFAAETDDQRRRKTANVSWLVMRRKQLFGLGQESGWNVANRRVRYEALSIATGHGAAYEAWKDTHDPQTGVPLSTASGSSRGRALKWLESREGITEQPANSNTDNREDGIRRAQIECAGGGQGLVRTAWCGEWCWRALDVAGVPNIDTWWMAGVLAIEAKARSGMRCYRGWRNGFDTNGVLPGDQVVIGGSGVHVETVRQVKSDSVITNGGNTSPGTSGSQSNGGGAFRRRRYPSEITGFALVDHVIDVARSIDQPLLPAIDEPFDVGIEELLPEELANKLAAQQEAERELPPEEQIVPTPRLPGLMADQRFPASDNTLPDDIGDLIAAQDEAVAAAEAAEEKLVEASEPVEDPAERPVP